MSKKLTRKQVEEKLKWNEDWLSAIQGFLKSGRLLPYEREHLKNLRSEVRARIDELSVEK